MANVYIGTSGFTLQHFYPETVKSGDKFSYFVKQFPTVEINSTFYHLPMEKTVARWKEIAPKHFVFAFKVWQNITHLKKGSCDFELLDTWFERFSIFEPNQHIMLFQFPANLKRNDQLLKDVLAKVPNTFLYAFEFRHQSWFCDELYTLLKESNACLVIADSPMKLSGERVWPLVDVDTADFAYIRFHGSPRLYASSYSTEDLIPYAQLIQQKLAQNTDVYCYFNNDAQAHAAENARTLQSLLT